MSWRVNGDRYSIEMMVSFSASFELRRVARFEGQVMGIVWDTR